MYYSSNFNSKQNVLIYINHKTGKKLTEFSQESCQILIHLVLLFLKKIQKLFCKIR